MWYFHKGRHINQWDRAENPEINFNIYDQLPFDKGAKTIEWGKNYLFTDGSGTTVYPHAKNEVTSNYAPKNKHKMEIDLSVKNKTIKLIEENTELSLHTLS